MHATPHGPVDVRALGADFYATSAYKWSGPHIGAVVADPALLETLRPDKLAPAPDDVPDRFEQGTLPFADLAGVTAAVEHLASLACPAPGSRRRRERILAGMAAAEAHEQELFGVLLGGLDAMDARHHLRQGRAAHRDRVLHRGGPHAAAGRRAPGRGEMSTCGTATTTRGSWPARSACGTPAAPCGRAWCTTTTGPTSTGCSPPLPSSS